MISAILSLIRPGQLDLGSQREVRKIENSMLLYKMNLKMLSPALLQTMKDYDPMRADMTNIETTLGWFTMTHFL